MKQLKSKMLRETDGWFMLPWLAKTYGPDVQALPRFATYGMWVSKRRRIPVPAELHYEDPRLRFGTLAVFVVRDWKVP
jgi:hypothetical protein